MEHWAPYRNQTPSWYDWKIVESNVKPKQTKTFLYHKYSPIFFIWQGVLLTSYTNYTLDRKWEFTVIQIQRLLHPVKWKKKKKNYIWYEEDGLVALFWSWNFKLSLEKTLKLLRIDCRMNAFTVLIKYPFK